MTRSRLIVSGLTLASAMVAMSLTGAVAPANAGANGANMSVYLGDLDLTTEGGARAALGRIDNAATKACGHAPRLTDIKRRQAHDACVDDMTARAVRKIGSPKLTKVHHKKRAEEKEIALRTSYGKD